LGCLKEKRGKMNRGQGLHVWPTVKRSVNMILKRNQETATGSSSIMNNFMWVVLEPKGEGCTSKVLWKKIILEHLWRGEGKWDLGGVFDLPERVPGEKVGMNQESKGGGSARAFKNLHDSTWKTSEHRWGGGGSKKTKVIN